MVDSCGVTDGLASGVLCTHFVGQNQVSKKGPEISFDSRDHAKINKAAKGRIVITTLMCLKIKRIDLS